MSKKRKSIRLDEHERRSLISLYLDKAIPVDQYEERHGELDELCQQWSALTGRTNASTDVLHYMRSQRKMGKWVRLDGKHVKREPHVKLSADEIEMLVGIYRENVSSIELGSDSIGYDEEIADLIAKEFAAEAGRIVPPGDLVATLTALRKRGVLPKVDKLRLDGSEEIGFGDIGLAQ